MSTNAATGTAAPSPPTPSSSPSPAPDTTRWTRCSTSDLKSRATGAPSSATATGYGTVGMKDGKPFLEVKEGRYPGRNESKSHLGHLRICRIDRCMKCLTLAQLGTRPRPPLAHRARPADPHRAGGAALHSRTRLPAAGADQAAPNFPPSTPPPSAAGAPGGIGSRPCRSATPATTPTSSAPAAPSSPGTGSPPSTPPTAK